MVGRYDEQGQASGRDVVPVLLGLLRRIDERTEATALAVADLEARLDEHARALGTLHRKVDQASSPVATDLTGVEDRIGALGGTLDQVRRLLGPQLVGQITTAVESSLSLVSQRSATDALRVIERLDATSTTAATLEQLLARADARDGAVDARLDAVIARLEALGSAPAPAPAHPVVAAPADDEGELPAWATDLTHVVDAAIDEIERLAATIEHAVGSPATDDEPAIPGALQRRQQAIEDAMQAFGERVAKALEAVRGDLAASRGATRRAADERKARLAALEANLEVLAARREE